ncbi:MAG: DUF3857 domain-containing protein [Deltaproteobacteria bacterium]|nr:DUF3857 domain-containing protein [Deltaproteobacteria bacterium]
MKRLAVVLLLAAAPTAHAAPRPWKGTDAWLGAVEKRVEAGAASVAALGWLHHRLEWRDEDTSPQRLQKLLQKLSVSPRAHPLVRDHAHLALATLALDAGDVTTAREHQRAAGVITAFQVLGPFENAGGGAFLAPLGVEEDPGLDRAHDGLARPVRWHPVDDVGPRGVLALHDQVWPNDDTLAAVLVWVRSDAPRDVALRLGASDQVAVVFNGEAVFLADAQHPVAFDQYAVPLHLEQGWNRLVFRVGQLRGGWNLAARLTAPDGSALAGVETSQDPVHEAEARSARFSPSGTAVADALAAVDTAARDPNADAAALEDAWRLHRALRADDERQRPAARVALLEEAQRRQPNDPFLLAALAEEQADDDVNHARELLQSAVAADPGFAPGWLALGRLRARQALPAEARAHLARAARDRTLTRAAVALAEERVALGTDVDGAVEALAAVARARPTLMALEGLMRLEQNRGGFPAAAAAAEKLRAAWPGHRGARAYLADTARRRGEWPRVLEAWRAAAVLEPHGEGPALEVATALWNLGRTDEAVDGLAAFTARHPDATGVWERLGDLQLRRGKARDAAEAWRALLLLKPQEAPLRRHVEALDSTERFEDRYVLPVEKLAAAAPPPGAAAAGAYVLGHLVAYRLYENGLTTQVVDMAYRLVDAARAPLLQKLSASYVPGRETFEVLRAERVTAAGQVFAADVDEQDPGGPVQGMYVDRRRVTVDYGHLERGDLIRLRYRLDASGERNLFGDFFGLMEDAQEALPKASWELVVEAPATRKLYARTQRLPPMTSTVEGDRVTWRLHADNLPALVLEPHMPPYTEVGAYAVMSTYGSWEELGRWYQGLVKDALVPDDAVRRATDELLPGAVDDDEKIRRIHRFVLARTRYVGIELGIHGWKPYRVGQVLARGYGDCKDKASLMVAMMKHAGVDARLALVRTNDLGPMVDLPSMWSFNHAIAYVPSRRLFLDGTAEFSGRGELPYQDQDAMVLTVDVADGRVERLSPAAAPSTANTNASDYVVELGADGSARLTGEERFAGARAPDERARLQDPATRQQVLEKDLSQVYPGARIVEASFSDSADLDAPVVYRFRAELPSFGSVEGGELVVPVTLYPHQVERTYAAAAQRTHDVVLPFPSLTRNRMRFVLPPGARVRLPATGGRDVHTQVEFTQVVTPLPDGWTVEETLHLKARRIPVRSYAPFRQVAVEADRRMAQKVRVTLPRVEAGRAP